LRLSKYGLDAVGLEETDHYRLMHEFCADPATFIDTVLSD
jgi:predicted ATPase